MIVPFTKTVGIEKGILNNAVKVQNHLGSIHAGAQFTLAENASGEYLTTLFPDLKESVIPLLRESSIKYTKEAKGRLYTKVWVEKDAREKFIKQLEKRGKSTLVVFVTLLDEVDEITCKSWFKWFIHQNE